MNAQIKRIVANTTEEEHLRVKLAATLQGSSVSRFVLDNVLAAAGQALAGIHVAPLSATDGKREAA